MIRDTPYGTISTDGYGCDCRIEATGDQLYAWANRSGAWWPCSGLARTAKVIVELADNGDLVDLAVYLPGEKYAQDSDDVDLAGDEVSAWIDDVLTADPGALASAVAVLGVHRIVAYRHK